MRILISSLAAILLLAGCGGRTAPAPAVAGDPAQAECRAEAQQAPAVGAAYRRVVIGHPGSEYQFEQARQDAENRAYTDCLRRRGLARGGGVEPMRRTGF
jgi:hypothetical protein